MLENSFSCFQTRQPEVERLTKTGKRRPSLDQTSLQLPSRLAHSRTDTGLRRGSKKGLG